MGIPSRFNLKGRKISLTKAQKEKAKRLKLSQILEDYGINETQFYKTVVKLLLDNSQTFLYIMEIALNQIDFIEPSKTVREQMRACTHLCKRENIKLCHDKDIGLCNKNQLGLILYLPSANKYYIDLKSINISKTNVFTLSHELGHYYDNCLTKTDEEEKETYRLLEELQADLIASAILSISKLKR